MKELFEKDFHVIISKTYDIAQEKLHENGYKNPDLWVLDLYFPIDRINSEKEISEMSLKFEQFNNQREEFIGYLRSIGQGPDGGLENLNRCRQNKINIPVAMFTRKSTIDDALKCLNSGANYILKKPMPHTLSKIEKERVKQLDEALIQQKDFIEEKFNELIKKNSHWDRYKTIYFSLFSLIGGIIITKIIERIFVIFTT